MTFPDEMRRHFPQCSSTNDLARLWALDTNNPAPHGAAVSTDFQTAGRGRRGRVWQAAPGESVLVSVILRLQFPLSEAGHLAFAAGLAVSDVLVELGLSPTLKWPNDVLLDGKKAAGVLVETVGGENWAAIVGIGLNVNTRAFPSDVTYAVPPTSLLLKTGQVHSVADLTDALVRSVPARAAQAWQTTLHDWRKRMATGIVLRRGHETGTFIDVNDDGAARVLLPDGTSASWTNVDGV